MVGQGIDVHSDSAIVFLVLAVFFILSILFILMTLFLLGVFLIFPLFLSSHTVPGLCHPSTLDRETQSLAMPPPPHDSYTLDSPRIPASFGIGRLLPFARTLHLILPASVFLFLVWPSSVRAPTLRHAASQCGLPADCFLLLAQKKKKRCGFDYSPVSKSPTDSLVADIFSTTRADAGRD
ncbi:hypothetical protein A9K55_004496 [Cordyceps militaris]|uniref:Uncharacterized protein n=1 Tax=Cordyceps militaris TaxID=73501 RepID=A0A2H4SMJ5_CORMI|nr:hypothetical protein A9K55_004496 [Cordyceps militaris]